MTTAIDQKIQKLEEQLKQEKAKKRAQEARKREAENKVKRAQETRKKILLGAVLMQAFEGDQRLKNHCMELLGKGLTRPDDRALFADDLPALAKPASGVSGA